MANFFTKAYRILNPFDSHTLNSSKQTSGGWLDATASNPNNQMLERAKAKGGVGGPIDKSITNNLNAFQSQVGEVFGRRAQGSGSGLAGGGGGGIIPDPVIPNNPNPPVNPIAAASRGATSRTTSPVSPPAIGQAPAGRGQSLGLWEGKEYFDPSELYNDQLSYLDSVYGTNLSKLRQGKQRNLDNFGRQRTGLAQQLAELLQGYDEQEEQGLGELSNYYGNLGDIYQSSEGVRKNEFRGSVENARGKSRTQARESESAIERAISEYLGEYDAQEQELARGYGGAKDEIGNRVVSDIGNRLNVRDIAASGVETDLNPEEITNNNALLGNLQKLQSSRIGSQSRIGGGQDATNAILQYLAGLQ